MKTYLWITIGSGLGGLLRYALTRATMVYSTGVPWGTIAVNILGCLVIGFFGTLTLAGGRHAVPENARLFVMVGLCGGFTTFSSFSLQTFDLWRSGAWVRALANVVLSVVFCFLAVALGHYIAQQATQRTAIAQTAEEEFTG